MSRDEYIGIVGAGPYGLALAHLLTQAGRKVVLWSLDEEVVGAIEARKGLARARGLILGGNAEATRDPEELASRARFVVVAVSSDSVEKRLLQLGEFVDGSHIAIHAIGAFATERDLRISQLIEECTPIKRSGVIAGPSLARDMLDGKTTSLVCASHFSEVRSEAVRLLSIPSVLRIYRGDDLIGVELASALAGAYTISLGLADALKVRLGTRAVVVTRAVGEMARLGQALGADYKTFSGLAGLGNLLVRSSVDGERESPSYRLGRALVKDPGVETQSEGARAAKAAARLGRLRAVSLPILDSTVAVLEGTTTAPQAAEEILRRVAQEE